MALLSAWLASTPQEADVCKAWMKTALSGLSSGDLHSLTSMPASPEHQAFGRLWPKGERVKHLGSVYPLGWRMRARRGVCPCTCAECRGEHCHHHPCPWDDVPAHGRGRMLCRKIKEQSWNEKMTTSSGEKALNSSMKFAPFFQINAPLRTCINHMLKVLEGWMWTTCVCLSLYLRVDWLEKRISTLGAPDHKTSDTFVSLVSLDCLCTGIRNIFFYSTPRAKQHLQ